MMNFIDPNQPAKLSSQFYYDNDDPDNLITLSPLELFKERYKETGHYFYRTLNVNAYEYSEFMYNAFKNYCELGIPWYDYKDCTDYIKTYNQYKLECDKYVSYRPNPLADLLIVYIKDSEPTKKVLLEIHPIESIKITLPKITGYTAKEVYACLSYIFVLDKRMMTLKDMHSDKPLTSLTEFYNYSKLFESSKLDKLWNINKIKQEKPVDSSNLCFQTSATVMVSNGTLQAPIFYWNLVKNDLDANAVTVVPQDISWAEVKVQLASDTLPKDIVIDTTFPLQHTGLKRALSHKFESEFDKNKKVSTVKTIPDYYDASKDLRKNSKGMSSFYNLDNFNAPLGETVNKSGINLRANKSTPVAGFTLYSNENKEEEFNEPPVQKKAVKLNWKEPQNDKRTYNNISNVLTSKKEDREI